MYFLLWLNSKLVSAKIKPPCLNSKSENPRNKDKGIINIKMNEAKSHFCVVKQ